jgi:hypothetical protein
MRRVLMVIGLLLPALLAAAPAEAARSVPRGFYGAMWNRAGTDAPPATDEDQFSLMASSGVESVRTVFSWAAAQPEAGVPPSFAGTDRIVALAAAHGVSLLPVVIYSPAWAARYPERPVSQPARAADYAAYLTALVGRYGPRGSFWAERPDLPRAPIRHWQVWNEPHLDGYWHATGPRRKEPWAPSYAALLRASAAAVHRADRGARVVTAGLADFVWRHLAALYRQRTRRAFDVVSMNLFTSTPANVLRGIRRVRAVARRFHDRRVPIWLTETTWPASKGLVPELRRPRWQLAWETTPDGAAARLSGLYRLAARARKRLRIGRVFWYTWATYYARAELFDYAGLTSWNGSSFTATPALGAYATMARRHQGCVKTPAGTCAARR